MKINRWGVEIFTACVLLTKRRLSQLSVRVNRDDSFGTGTAGY